jgi:hypothetical protein
MRLCHLSEVFTILSLLTYAKTGVFADARLLPFPFKSFQRDEIQFRQFFINRYGLRRESVAFCDHRNDVCFTCLYRIEAEITERSGDGSARISVSAGQSHGRVLQAAAGDAEGSARHRNQRRRRRG